MRGLLSRPPRRALAAPSARRSALLLVAASTAFVEIFSGCSSVSADRSAAHFDKISVIPSIVEFHSVVVGQKNSQTLKITNTSHELFDLKTIHVVGTGFALSSSNSKLPIVLAPGKSTHIAVVFAPSTASSAGGEMIIHSPDSKNPMSIRLSGSGETSGPSLQISPASVNFGSRPPNSSNFESITLKNDGNASLKIDSVKVSNSAFSISGLSVGVSLAPGQFLNFLVWFHPPATGSWSAKISVASPSLSSPITLPIAGSASNSSIAAPAAASLHAVTLD